MALRRLMSVLLHALCYDSVTTAMITAKRIEFEPKVDYEWQTENTKVSQMKTLKYIF